MEMFREASKKWGRRHVDLIVSTISSFGLRVRSDIDAETMGMIIAAFSEGVALRLAVNPELTNIKRSTGTDEALTTWNAAAIGLEGVLLSLTEPDPAMKVAADLSTWTAF